MKLKNGHVVRLEELRLIDEVAERKKDEEQVRA